MNVNIDNVRDQVKMIMSDTFTEARGISRDSELNNVIRWTVGGIDGDMLYSAVLGIMTSFTCLIPYGGGHIEHLLL
ncbi:hypothetical protein CDAR_282561 [Caerostris darwini]|uniref:Uncharacterized protein n=1 Tax=Caerostris darwini TaxID=1538125 RepID=A0AAV4X8D4_9ARAC|nr:hypothetical protein CDAR_282561 [Caerostris darwini]